MQIILLHILPKGGKDGSTLMAEAVCVCGGGVLNERGGQVGVEGWEEGGLLWERGLGCFSIEVRGQRW